MSGPRTTLFGPILLVALLSFSLATNLILPTPSWAWDDKAVPVQPWLMGLVACLLLCCYPPVRLAAIVMLAGLLGNFLAAVHGDVANPLVWGNTAYNLADMYLLVGYVMLPLSVPWVYRDVKRRLA